MLQAKTNLSKTRWQDEYKKALRSTREINSYFGIHLPEEISYQSFIPLRFAHKILKNGLNGILAKQFLPQINELNSDGKVDPIGDKLNAKSDGIIHRYHNRILFTPTTNCPIICRYCFRKNELTAKDEIFKHKLSTLEEYLIANSQVDEVILTGGDPLILSDSKISQILDLLFSCNIKFVRFHTRTPIILPERITNEFIDMLNRYTKKFTRVIFCLHVNHSEELDTDVVCALEKLRDCKIDKKTQTVLLKDINNDPKELIKLFNRLIDHDFTPYYLHHPDQVKGGMHFYVPVEEGRAIYNQLRNKLSGWAIPHYVIDQAEGRGKQLAFNPENFSFSGYMLDKDSNFAPY